jgi:TrmH family RNA methyltransferase
MKKYSKELDYSYTLGIFPTIELINRKHDLITKIVLSNEIKADINNKLLNLCNTYNIEHIYDDSFIKKVSDKENCYVVGIFKKEHNKLDTNKSHLVLVNPSNMGNVGTIIRTMLGFNYKDLAIIMPSVDIFNPKVIRASMGSIFGINIELFSSFEEYTNLYNNHKIYTFMLDGEDEIQDVKEENIHSLVFGNESSGLDESYKKYNSVVIPHSVEIDSLNLTIAIGISLYKFSSK